MSEPRVLVVGHGLIGRQRAQAVLEHGATLAGTVDPVAPGRPDAPHFAAVADVPAGDYDAAIVALPHDVAVAAAHTILRGGRPVLIEKPLGLRAQQAQRLVAAAATLGAPSFVGYNYRFLPGIRAILDAAAQGRLGTLRTIDLLIGHGGHPGSADGWKLQPDRAGGGVVLDPGVHLLDLLLLLEPRLALEHAAATRGFWKTGIEEDVVLTFAHERLIATVRVSHVRWVNTLRVEVVGEDGYGIAEGRGGNYGDQTLRLGRRWAWAQPGAPGQRDTEERRDFGPGNASLTDEVGAVLARWRGAPPAPGPAPATFRQALAVTALVDAVYDRIGRA
ncbi:MAG TPA: Gfo/Idh/MocA family oxidoreductase [Baekduia sp.]|uniref:Gfo/Idh/MocA family protein n=1 Tax=Baekduia sp. TaxID=2600305 RepID=UPI002CDF5B14|nr:Gfo/Idh/MocA family oxidoreductase [Baekduia sp.]HMJ34322.1 Gfo/Idh/MocA family oxidoreductase [Baekduia sp.]